MTGSQNNLYRLILFFLVSLSVASLSRAQQGQYHINVMPFDLPELVSGEAFATYSPVKSINGATIQLKGEDGSTFTFALDAKTIYCQGAIRVLDWSFLKNVKKNLSVTVLTLNETDNKALVVWDQPPVLATIAGKFKFTLPPLCR
jgi:hypothetical protein